MELSLNIIKLEFVQQVSSQMKKQINFVVLIIILQPVNYVR